MTESNKEFKKLPFKEKMKDKEYRYGYYSGYLFFLITIVITFISMLFIHFILYPLVLITFNFLNLAICFHIYFYITKKLEKEKKENDI